MSYVLTAVSVAGLGYSIYSGSKANKEKKIAQDKAEKELNSVPAYKIPDSSREMLADARSERNAVSPAYLAAQQQGMQQAAAQRGYAQRNATSGSEALAAGANAQGQYNNSMPGLLGLQQQYSQQNKGLFYNALQNMSEEERAKYMADKSRSSDMFNYNLGVAGAANQAKNQAIQAGAQYAGGLISNSGSYGNMGGQARFAFRGRPTTPYGQASPYKPLNQDLYPTGGYNYMNGYSGF